MLGLILYGWVAVLRCAWFDSLWMGSSVKMRLVCFSMDG